MDRKKDSQRVLMTAEWNCFIKLFQTFFGKRNIQMVYSNLLKRRSQLISTKYRECILSMYQFNETQYWRQTSQNEQRSGKKDGDDNNIDSDLFQLCSRSLIVLLIMPHYNTVHSFHRSYHNTRHIDCLIALHVSAFGTSSCKDIDLFKNKAKHEFVKVFLWKIPISKLLRDCFTQTNVEKAFKYKVQY